MCLWCVSCTKCATKYDVRPVRMLRLYLSIYLCVYVSYVYLPHTGIGCNTKNTPHHINTQIEQWKKNSRKSVYYPSGQSLTLDKNDEHFWNFYRNFDVFFLWSYDECFWNFDCKFPLSIDNSKVVQCYIKWNAFFLLILVFKFGVTLFGTNCSLVFLIHVALVGNDIFPYDV